MIPTAATMIIPNDAKFRPVHKLLRSVVLVALPSVPRSISLATSLRLPDMITDTRITAPKTTSEITSVIRILFTYFFLIRTYYTITLNSFTGNIYMEIEGNGTMGSKILNSALQKIRQLRKPAVEVTQLALGTKKSKINKPINRKVQNARGYAVVQIPQKILDQLNIIFNSELYVEYSDINFMLSEIKIRLYNKNPSDKELKQSHSQRKR